MVQVAAWGNGITRLELWLGRIWVHDPTTYSYPWLLLPLGVMRVIGVWVLLGVLLGPEGHLAVGVISISVAYTVTGAMVARGPRLLLRPTAD